MDCAAVQPLLSPFMDGELEGSDADAVALHIDHCLDCQSRLNEMRNLDEIWSSVPPPEPSAQAWKRIGRNLANLDDGSPRRFRNRGWLAASILLLLCCGAASALVKYGDKDFWDKFQSWRAPINLVDYIDNEHMQAAGKSVDPDAVCSMVTFRTLKAPDLPDNYKLRKCSFLNDGVVRYEYARGDSEVILLLYDCGHTVIHGNKPFVVFDLEGKPLKVATCKKRVSGSWEVKDTAISIISCNDLNEFYRLLNYVDRQLSEER
jgi:Putative zinc-finger